MLISGAGHQMMPGSAWFFEGKHRNRETEPVFSRLYLLQKASFEFFSMEIGFVAENH
jgi:hypothetical protein